MSPCHREDRYGRHLGFVNRSRTSPIVAATVLLLCGTRAALAQPLAGAVAAPPAPQRGDIHGRVVTATDAAPVRGATIVITGATDTIPVARASTRADGVFHIAGLARGRYRGQVRVLGFSRASLPVFSVESATSSVDLGTVTLVIAAVELQRMNTVADQQRAIELAPDRNTFAVKDMPTTRGGSAIDVLRNIPSVDIDMDNAISLRGDAGVIVQINGRRSPMKPAQLGNFLAQLSAAMIEKIEVIPNPSARENPEGSSGIINIVLKKQTDAGSSGGLAIAGGTTGRAEVGANAGYQKQGLTAFGSYGFSRDNRPRGETLLRDNLYATPLTFLNQTGVRTQIPKIQTVTGSLRYRVGKHDEFSSDLLYSTRREDETYALTYRDLDAQRRLTALRDRRSTSINNEDSFESTLEYKHTFAAEDHELSSELRFARSSEGGPSDYVSRVLGLDGTSVVSLARESIAPMERPNERSLRIDYAKPLAEHLRLSAGYRGALQKFRTTIDTRIPGTTQTDFVIDPTRSTAFTFDQAVNAAYGIVTGSVGKLTVQTGLRVERANTQFRRMSSAIVVDNHYASVFPSGLAVYNVDDQHQFKLSYSTRIRRPDDTDQLDPTPHYQDPLNLSRGNPFLRPEYIRALEAGVQRTAGRTTLQVTPFYRHTVDAIRRVRSIDDVGVTTTTFANIATTDTYGADATLALRGGPLTGFVGSSAFRQQSNASNLSPTLSARTFGWTSRANVAWRVSKAFDMQTIISYRGKTTVEQGTNGAQTRVSFAARQKLNGDRISLTMRVTDPFSTERERSSTSDPRFTQSSMRYRRARGVLVNVAWNFGKPQKEKRLDEGDPTGG